MPKCDNMVSYKEMEYLKNLIQIKRLKYKDISFNLKIKPNTMHTYFYNMRMPKSKYIDVVNFVKFSK